MSLALRWGCRARWSTATRSPARPRREILGEVTRPAADLLRRADAIFIEELRAAKDADGTSWYDLTAQAFAVFLPVKSVGVMGDGRTYENVVALRRADHRLHDRTLGRVTAPLLAKVSNRIINEVRGFNRVVYDISVSLRRRSSGMTIETLFVSPLFTLAAAAAFWQ